MAEIQWTDLGRKYMIKRGDKTNMVDYDESNIQMACHTIADNMSSSRPIMQKELEGEIIRLPLALTKRQSEQFISSAQINGEEEDKSEVSSEVRNKSQLVYYRKQNTGMVNHPDRSILTQGENDTPSAEGDLTDDPDVILQTIPNKNANMDTELNSPGFFTPS